MTTTTTDYLRDAAGDAADTVRNFADEILEQLLDTGEASDDLLNDYPNGDAWHHQNHVDKWYSLIDAATLIDQLSHFEETDSGLWEGQQPKEAISTCAAFTYGNAVASEWHDLIEEINGHASDIIDDYDGQIASLEEEIEELNNQAEGALAKNAKKYQREAARKQVDLEALQADKKTALEELIQATADNA
jgi:hypothetical protein